MTKKIKGQYQPNRDGMWLFMRDYKTFTVEEIAFEMSLDKNSVKAYVRMLVKGGFLGIVENTDNARKPNRYKLVRDIGRIRPELKEDGTPLPVTGNQKMWMAMKVLKTFTYKEVCLSAMTDQEAAKRYCIELRRAGYLILHKKAIAPHTPETYIFNKKMDSGYYAPQVKRQKIIFDRNLNKVIWSGLEAA